VIAALAFLAALVAPLPDPAQEARAQALDAEIRCVACENEPISQSTAEIATDMRMAVRERIAAGDSDAQVRTFFARRYGEFVLFRPPVTGGTIALWSTPLVLLALGLALIWRMRAQSPKLDPGVSGEADDEI
jgi:cytochrome c-type biogenesis protein CcmH